MQWIDKRGFTMHARNISRKGAKAQGKLAAAWRSFFAPLRLCERCCCLYLCLVASLPLHSQSDEAIDPNAPPLAGQPEDFSGAVGRFQVSMRATPTELRADDPLTLTIRITALSPVAQPPARPNLRRLPTFSNRFHIEQPMGDQPDRALPNQRTWEFDYRLRPKNTSVTAIPNLRFDFFRPGFVPAEKGYQTSWAYAIPLTVKPREQPELPTTAAMPRAPEAFYRITTGPAVLQREEHGSLTRPVWLASFLFGAPLSCLVWYGCWHYWYPDVVRQARQRRSRAARKALHALHALPAGSAAEQARQCADIVAHYLRQRLDLRVTEPTPAEVASHLERHDCPPRFADYVAGFFRDCAAARFAPHFTADSDWPVTAGQLLLTLEAEPWLAQD